ncbi:hypothetical protein HNV11_17200 [Spirosoma taeanense]|uniref:Uncharacterized protein n=1 Tax=Spirosoma taeanense TaxID=2735870 RepID=A0A6M5YCI5_9BACT|nr:hypothetical protein [Spirosoma taeanense]QJW90986.1 hypothetical protein HNV11_17200 [Spirosoma taeanense]
MTACISEQKAEETIRASNAVDRGVTALYTAVQLGATGRRCAGSVGEDPSEPLR